MHKKNSALWNMANLHANKVWKLINMENNVGDEQKYCLGTNLKHKVDSKVEQVKYMWYAHPITNPPNKPCQSPQYIDNQTTIWN